LSNQRQIVFFGFMFVLHVLDRGNATDHVDPRQAHQRIR
jgi:hypothetical protein